LYEYILRLKHIIEFSILLPLFIVILQSVGPQKRADMSALFYDHVSV